MFIDLPLSTPELSPTRKLDINSDLGSATGQDRKCEGRDSVRVVAYSECMVRRLADHPITVQKRRYGKFHANFPQADLWGAWWIFGRVSGRIGG